MYAAGIYGDAKVDDYVGNIFLKFTPTKNWLVNLGFRDEYNVTASSGGFNVTSLASAATSTAREQFHRGPGRDLLALRRPHRDAGSHDPVLGFHAT